MMKEDPKVRNGGEKKAQGQGMCSPVMSDRSSSES